tara:strand:+ start:3225 stop:4127 length:903 start_codon:yes stop_codon:yes gene_type:complete
MKRQFRHWIRKLIHRTFVRVDISEKHIFLFATRRGGSTLARDLLYASLDNFDFIDQPFDYNQFNPHKHHFGSQADDQIIVPKNDANTILKDYMDNILNGRYYIRSQWDFRNKYFSKTVEGFILKLINCKGSIEWFYHHFKDQAEFILLLRNPISVARSIEKLNWKETTEMYIRNPYYAGEILGSNLVSFIEDEMNRTSYTERLILNWYVENYGIYHFFKKHKLAIFLYEDLVAKPKEILEEITTKQINLGFINEVIKRPTRSVFDKKSNAMLQNQNNVSESLKELVISYSKKFEIEEYPK